MVRDRAGEGDGARPSGGSWLVAAERARGKLVGAERDWGNWWLRRPREMDLDWWWRRPREIGGRII